MTRKNRNARATPLPSARAASNGANVISNVPTSRIASSTRSCTVFTGRHRTRKRSTPVQLNRASGRSALVKDPLFLTRTTRRGGQPRHRASLPPLYLAAALFRRRLITPPLYLAATSRDVFSHPLSRSRSTTGIYCEPSSPSSRAARAAISDPRPALPFNQAA
jgi:hypothetical protein